MLKELKPYAIGLPNQILGSLDSITRDVRNDCNKHEIFEKNEYKKNTNYPGIFEKKNVEGSKEDQKKFVDQTEIIIRVINNQLKSDRLQLKKVIVLDAEGHSIEFHDKNAARNGAICTVLSFDGRFYTIMNTSDVQIFKHKKKDERGKKIDLG